MAVVLVAEVAVWGCPQVGEQSISQGRSTEGFLTPNLFHATSLGPWGSRLGSIKAEFHEELKFQGFILYFSARIKQISKMSEIELKNTIFGWFFEVCSILTEK